MCDREQSFLLPPDVCEWLPEDHFAWFVLDAVAQMDLAAFYGAYRADGHGRAAFDPGMVVAVLLYAYARGTGSSRAIERGCEEDVAYRVIAANQVPDHSTLARFRQRHQDALAGLFGRSGVQRQRTARPSPRSLAPSRSRMTIMITALLADMNRLIASSGRAARFASTR